MKQESDTLHSLIRSLNEDERKGFKKTLSTYTIKGRKNFFIILCNSLENLEEYSFQALAARTKSTIAPTSLSSLKSQLKKKLIAYLRENDTHHYKHWHEMLEEAHILCRRNIFDEAQILLKKVMDEANAANRKYYTIAALRIQGLTLQHLNENDMVSSTVSLGNEIAGTAKDLLLTSQIYDFYMTIAAITFQGNMAVRDGKILAKLKFLLTDEVYNLPLAALHPDQQFVLLVGKYNLNRLLCRVEDLSVLASQRMQLVKNHTDYFQKYQPHNIPGTYVDYIEGCTLAKNESGFNEGIRQLKAYIEAHLSGVDFYVAYYVYLQHSYVVSNEALHDKLHKAIVGLEKFYASKPYLPVLIKKLFEMSLLQCYYKIGNYDNAFIYSRKLTQENISGETAHDVEGPIRIFDLAMRFEKLLVTGFKQNELATLASLATSEYHHFRKKKDADYSLELAILSVFREVSKAPKKESLVHNLGKLRNSIQTWMREDVVYVKTFDLGFKIVDWVDRQIDIISSLKVF